MVKNQRLKAKEIQHTKSKAMKQTRHSFGTYHLSKGTNPLIIAKVMGHRDAEMVIKVYGKYIEDAVGIDDSMSFTMLLEAISKKKNQRFWQNFGKKILC